MRYLITVVIAALSLNAFGQTEYPYPYNPDGNNDGLISLNDLMDLLALYGLEYNAGVLATDSISAIYYTGEMDYWDCASSCVGLSGNWKDLDHYLVGSYKDDLLESPNAYVWLDHVNRIKENSVGAVLRKEDWAEAYDHEYFLNDCFCQTRTRADIEDISTLESPSVGKQLGFSLSEGTYSPDTLSYWRIDAINLKNDPATFYLSGMLQGCYYFTSTSYPYTKCVYTYSQTAVEVLKLGDISVTVNVNTTGNDFNAGSGDLCSTSPCPSTNQFGHSFSNTSFNKLNFPIYISADQQVEIMSSDIILSITEYSIQY